MKAKKKTELFVINGQTDKKHKLNTCNFVVSQDILDKIECGISIEELNELRGQGFDIFKYQTQITIHGLFPELVNRYLGSYQTLTQNKNKSIGVKWNGVDYNKKMYICDMLQMDGFKIEKNSTEWYAYKTHKLNKENMNEIKSLYEGYKAMCEKMSGFDYFGSVSTYFGDCGFYGTYLFFEIKVNGILDKNKDAFIEAITDKSVDIIKAAYQEKIDKRNREADAAWAKVEADRAKRNQEFEIAKKKFLEQGLPNGVQFFTTIDIIDGLQVGKFSFNQEEQKCGMYFERYVKSPRQKKFRVNGRITERTKLCNVYVILP